MKQKKYLAGSFLILAALIAAFAQSSTAQYLFNEIEIDPPNATSDACQYVEIRGPGGVIPAGTIFVSVNADSSNYGNSSVRINLGGVTVGSNGTVTLVNTSNGPCTGRVFPAGTTLINYSSPTWVGAGANSPGSEAYLLVNTSAPGSFLGPIGNQDLDVDDNGVIDPAFGITGIQDGFQLSVVGSNDFVYGSQFGVQVIYDGEAPGNTPDLPDAVTRFAGNNTPFAASAFYYGELATTSDETVEYATPRSANFPSGGALTPGAANVPTAVVPGDAVVDFNGDGKTDFSVTRNSGGQMTWYNSINGSTETRFVQFGSTNDVPTPEDFDGDNKDDIAVWRPGAPFVAAFWILRSSDNTFQAIQFGQTGDDPAVVGDWDGDGFADPAVYRDSAFGTQSGFYFRGSLSNPGGNISFIPWGVTGDKALRGDFDGDAKPDAAVYRSSNQVWYIRKSSDAQLIATPFGLPTDVRVPGDFDGDGKTDFAVFRDGTWIVQRISNGQVTFSQWGVAGDLPVVGDYNGDGSADLAVWRAGIYYVLQSGGSPSYIPWGQAGDLPVASVFNN